MDKEKLLTWINKRIEESVRFLDDNGVEYDDVLNNNDTGEYSEESENNNFEAGVISALLELKKEIEENKF